MSHLVFTAKPEPTYDDLLWERYHFPSTYVNLARTGIGKLVIYYEPRRPTPLEHGGGRQCYFAAARIDDIRPDPVDSTHYYASVSNYIQFDRPVPFRERNRLYESQLGKQDGSINKGRFGRSIRALLPGELEAILAAGFPSTNSSDSTGLDTSEPETVERPIQETVLHRPFRDAMFRKLVRRAYMGTCAMTGLNIANGGGSLEVEGAHIRPVAAPHKGPDSIRNGIALSRTLHWLFDHGCVTVDDDMSILTARSRFPDKLKSMLNADGKVLLPRVRENRPHRQFLKYHRDVIFKE